MSSSKWEIDSAYSMEDECEKIELEIKIMQKKLNKTDEVKKELYNGFLNMFGIGKGGCPWITFVVKHVKEKSIEGSNAKFTWGVKNGTELKKVVPNFSVLQEVSLVEGMKELVPVYCVIGKIPAVRNISNKIIVLEKGE